MGYIIVHICTKDRKNSIKQLRTLCNSLNVSCVDEHGNYLKKSKLAEILMLQSGAGETYENHFKTQILPEYIKDLTEDPPLVNPDDYSPTEYEIEMIKGNRDAGRYMSTSEHRVDYRFCRCYSIDPPGSEDADDAFSIFNGSDDKLYLVIHIADPTAFIDPLLPLWEHNIRRRVVTRYPSNTKPFHMLPREILDYCTLMTDSDSETFKPALSFQIEIDKMTYLPVGESHFNVSWVKISKADHFTYQDAAALERKDTEGLGVAAAAAVSLNNKAYDDFKLCKEIAAALRIARGGHTIAGDIVERFTSEGPVVHNLEVMWMKNVIEEFAILMNVKVGEYLMERDVGIFRHMSGDIDAETASLEGEELINKLVTLGSFAIYTDKPEKHKLIGNKIYSHSTSPMRRSTDCVIHYLLKSFIIPEYRNLFVNTWGIDLWPFTNDYIREFANEATEKSRYICTKIAKLDQKFRFVQYVHMELERDSAVSCVIRELEGNSHPYQNIIIKSLTVAPVDGTPKTYNTYISYTHFLDRGIEYIPIPGEYNVILTKVHPDTVKLRRARDSATFPDIDAKMTELTTDRA